MGSISRGTIARSETPVVGPVALVLRRILDAVSAINQSKIPIILKVIREAIVDSSGVEAHIGIVGEEQRIALCSDVQLDAEVSPTVKEPIFRVIGSVVHSLRVISPTRVVQTRGHRMCR